MNLSYTKSDLSSKEIGPPCRGRGHFFVHEESAEFRVVIINGFRVKAEFEEEEDSLGGAFNNGNAPSFIENRNLHKLPQGARGAVVMFDPLPTDNT